jgi:HD-like signal output (HDOD) protein
MTPAEHSAAPAEEENEALALFLQQLSSRDDFPAFVRNVENINDVVHDPKAKVQLLNDAIGGDVALSLKVLRIANSAIYAAAGRTVQTVYQAIMLLGFERMKDIAVGAAVFEHLKHRSTDLRELMACSLLTANQALVVCGRTGFARAEVAYLCGIFRNLGELVCACYKPKEYAEFKQMPRGEDDPGATAERQAFGFRFDELGQAIARQWGLPAAITDAMYRPPAIGPARGDGPGTLAAITQLSADLTQSIYRSAPWEQKARLRDAVQKYGYGLGIDEEGALDIARTALEESQGALKSANAGVDPTGLRERLAYVREQVLGPAEGAVGAAGEARVPLPPPRGSLLGDSGDHPAVPGAAGHWVFGDTEPDRLPEPTLDDCMAAATSLREAITGGRPLGTDEAVARTLAALLSLGFQRAALLLAADGYTRLRVRTALGEGSEYLTDRLNLTLVPPNSALALAVVRKEDIFADLKAGSPFRMDASIKRLRSASFAMLPVVVSGQTIGAIFADSVRKPIEFHDGFREPLVSIRGAMQLAFERLRELAQQARPRAGAA